MRARGRFLGVVLAVSVATVIAGCGSDDDGTTTNAAAASQPPGATTATDPSTQIVAAQATLAEIVDRDRHDTSYHVDGFRTDPTVSPAFVSGVDVATESAKASGATGLDFDPIICAQNLPRRVHYRAAPPRGGQIAIVGILAFGIGKPVRVHYSLVLDGSVWKLNGTDCLEQAVGGEE
jgi:hypothetical protein